MTIPTLLLSAILKAELGLRFFFLKDSVKYSKAFSPLLRGDIFEYRGITLSRLDKTFLFAVAPPVYAFSLEVISLAYMLAPIYGRV